MQLVDMAWEASFLCCALGTSPQFELWGSYLVPAVTEIPNTIFGDSPNTGLLYSLPEPTYLPWNGL